MIATRFRSVYWVGGVAVAALGCYLVSQRVAAERADLAKVETAIMIGERQIRALETEIGTRAGMKQIERWNVDVLALTAPKSAQFVTDDTQLAALVQPVQPAMDAPAVVQVAAIDDDDAPAMAPHITRASYEAPIARRAVPEPEAPKLAVAKSATKKTEATRPAKAKPAKPTADQERLADRKHDKPEKKRDAPRVRDADDAPRLRSAVFVKPAVKAAAAPQKVALLDEKLLGDLGRLARNERTGGKRTR
jgi:hypothetical protein